MCVFKSLTGYTDSGGYVVKRDSAYTHISVNDHIVAGSVFLLPSVFIQDQQQVYHPFWTTASKIVNYHNEVAEDIWFGWQKIERNVT